MSNQTLIADAEAEPTADAQPVQVAQLGTDLSVRRLSGGWRWWLVPLVLGVVAGVLYAVNDRHDSDQAHGEDARRIVVTHVEELLSYDYSSIEDDLARERGWLTGSFADEYAGLVEDEIAPAAERARVTTEATVSASGVVAAGHDEVELLLFVNVTTRSKELDEPRVSGSRLAVTATHVDGEWRISSLDPV